jgi:hypothetical protein
MVKEQGWIKLHRKIQESANYFDEPFCRNMAWVDMLLLANHDENSFRVRGIKVVVKRGQIGFTHEKLGSRWRWSRGKVLRFLKELQNDMQIVQQKSNITTLISILNYEKYQGYSTTNSTANDTADGTTERQQTVQQTDTNKNVKNDNNDKELNKIYNSGGEISSPAGPPPDVILPTINFSASDFNGLPNTNNESVRRFLKVVKKLEVSEDEISELWVVFKNQELTGVKLYRNKDDVYRHFLNWAKKQSFRKGTTVRQKPKATLPKKIIGVEFINDFSQCRMSDGSIVELDRNQSDQAKFNQINPNAILAV